MSVVGVHAPLVFQRPDAAKDSAAQGGLQRQIGATDRQARPDAGRIDQISSGTETRRYAFYGLTDDGIRIVEEATQK